MKTRNPIITCCYKCLDRVVNCHSTCEKYKAQKQRYTELKAEYEKGREADAYLTAGSIQRQSKAALARRKHVTVRRNYK